MRAGEPCADTGGLPGASGRRGVGPISTFRGGRAAPRCPGVVTAQPVGSPRSPSCHQAARRPAAWCLGGLRGASAGCVVRRGAAWCVGWLRGASEGCVVRRLAAWCLGGLRGASAGCVVPRGAACGLRGSGPGPIRRADTAATHPTAATGDCFAATRHEQRHPTADGSWKVCCRARRDSAVGGRRQIRRLLGVGQNLGGLVPDRAEGAEGCRELLPSRTSVRTPPGQIAVAYRPNGAISAASASVRIRAAPWWSG